MIDVETMADEYRTITPLEERIQMVDTIANAGKTPLTVALCEALLIGNDAPWRYSPAEYSQKMGA